MTLLDDAKRMWGQVTYKTGFYDAETIQRLADGLGELTASVSREPGLRVSEVPVAAGVGR